MIKTTIISRIFIAVLCVFGLYQIVQLAIGDTTKTETPKKLSEEKASLASVSLETDGTDDPFVANLPLQAKTYLKDHFTLEDKDVEWVKRDYGMEAIFKQNGRTYEVEFDHSGNWVETELENVPSIEVPSTVINAAKALYPISPITEFEIELTAKGTFYEVEMATDKGEVELYFDNNGKRMKNTNEDK